MMLDSNERQVIEDLKKAFQCLDLPILLVGATARLIVFDARYNIRGRSTKDIDIAISIEEWSTYHNIINSLTQGDQACFKLTKIQHRLIHIKTEMLIDLVPFGKIGEPDQEIKWTESEKTMNVAGFLEALENAETLEDLDIKVVSLPALIGLKLLAYNDRKSDTKKDLDDLDFILKNYQNDEEVYADQKLLDKFIEGEIEYQDAAIYLLGKKISQIFLPATLTQIKQILNQLLYFIEDEPFIEPEKQRLNILKQGIQQQ